MDEKKRSDSFYKFSAKFAATKFYGKPNEGFN